MSLTRDPGGEDWFTPRSQDSKPVELRVRFKVRGLIGTEAMDVKWDIDEAGRWSMTARGGNACLRAGLLGWENRVKDGKALEFDPDPAKWKANVDSLYPMDALDLAMEIWRRTHLTEEARKN